MYDLLDRNIVLADQLEEETKVDAPDAGDEEETGDTDEEGEEEAEGVV
ncbi:hypothetical protein HYW67_00975 [Candidatus Parcubacteria bacterium]|nr:hypothetical protein [Candidatus Parcubacteria bacterium]